jgi:hypothetical protein
MASKTTIHGIVIPAAWNNKGEVTSVIIATYNEGKYLVKDTPAGRRLLPFLRKRVVVMGMLDRNDTVNFIDVDSFHLDTSSI